MDKFCIITNRDKDKDFETTKSINDYLTSKGKRVSIVSGLSSEQEGYTDISTVPKDTECAIVLGGDGTIIQAVNDLMAMDIPILGINLGTLGFLAEIEKHDIFPVLDSFLNGVSHIERRMMLEGKVFCGNKCSYEGTVLNDIVIGRNGFSRLINVKIYVNEELVNTYMGDGVIISTPTGSTGYNLSAGGPVVLPVSKNIIITPICPHSLNNRSIIVTSEDSVTVQIGLSKKTQEEEAIATFDGRMGVELKTGDIIKIGKAQGETKLVKLNHSSFFEILRSKLGGGNI